MPFRARCEISGLSLLSRFARVAVVFGFLSLGAGIVNGADTIEFLNGAKLEGQVLEINDESRQIEIEVQIAGVRRLRKYGYDKVRRVVWNGRRFDLTAAPVTDGARSAIGIEARGVSEVLRTPEQVRSIIQTTGSTAPDWFESTPLAYPKTLDLSWPVPPPQPWNNQRNIGQFIWDKINPNARQWRAGIRFVYYLLSLHKNSPELRQRAMKTLGGMYFRFFQDYPRAAYWWEQSGVRGGDNDSVGLAECYFQLGNKEMAERILDSTGASLAKIKLLGEMGDTENALQLADSLARWSRQTHEAYLIAGDICRLSDQFQRAIQYYQKVLSAPAARNEDYSKRYRGRARDSIESIRRFELLDIRKLSDGVYRGGSLGYEAPIRIEATVKSGRVVKLEVTEHREKQYYSALRDVPNQILRKQNLKNVDATSRATITGVAIINATAQALTGSAR